MQTSNFKIIYINHSDIESREEGYRQKRKVNLLKNNFSSRFELLEQICTNPLPNELDRFNLPLNPLTHEDQLFFSRYPQEYGRFLTHFMCWHNLAVSEFDFFIIMESYSSALDVFNLLQNPLKMEGQDFIDISKTYHPHSLCYILTKDGAHKLTNVINNPSLLNNCSDLISPEISLAKPAVYSQISTFINWCKENGADVDFHFSQKAYVSKTESFFFKESRTIDTKDSMNIVNSDTFKFWEKPYIDKTKTFSNKILMLVLVTEAEIKSGQLYTMMSRYFAGNASLNYSIDIIICTNKEITEQRVQSFDSHVNINSIKFVNMDISEKEDTYITDPQKIEEFINENKYIPALGFTSGPNKLFYDSMLDILDCKHGDYKNIFMCEADSRNIIENWIDSFIDYIDSHDFIIAGSRYKSFFEGSETALQPWTGHLNGIALYRAGDDLKYLLNGSMNLVKHSIVTKAQQFLSFDVANHLFSHSMSGIEVCYNDEGSSKLIDSKLITNISPSRDRELSLEFVLENHPKTVIIHQKL